MTHLFSALSLTSLVDFTCIYPPPFTIFSDKSEVLEDEHSFYWGTRQQLLFGKVICDWLATQNNEKASMDPIFGTLLNPTGGTNLFYFVDSLGFISLT